MLVNDVPADILALPRAVVRSEAPHTLPPRPAATETTGPAAPRDTALLERPAGPAVERDGGGDQNGCERTEAAPPHKIGSDAPSEMGVAEGLSDVLGHSVQ